MYKAEYLLIFWSNEDEVIAHVMYANKGFDVLEAAHQNFTLKLVPLIFLCEYFWCKQLSWIPTLVAVQKKTEDSPVGSGTIQKQ